MFVKIIFTLDYEEGHPLYIDALICFHTKRIRKYQIENAKIQLLYQLDYLFNPAVTNEMKFMGIEKIYDRVAKKEGLKCPDYPNSRVIIIWKHREDGYKQKFDEIQRIDL